MRVYFRKQLGWLLVILGALTSALMFKILLYWPLPLLILLWGISILKQPYFSISENQLTFYQLGGYCKHTHKFQSLQQLSIQENGTLFLKIKLINEEGRVEIISIGKHGVDSQDLQEFIQFIKANDRGNQNQA